MEQNRRRVLAVGLPLDDSNGTGPPDPDALDLLAEAPEHAAAVAAAFEAFGYEKAESIEDPIIALDVAIRRAVNGGNKSLLVVHVVGHGRLRGGTHNLYIVAPDGGHVSEPVNHWVDWVEDMGTNGPITLFILDVCHAGRSLDAAWQSSISAENRRAWVLGAAVEEAYDFRLSRAVSQVLRAFATKELQVDPSLQFIPLRKLGTEVDRVVAELSADSPSTQTLDATPIRWTETAILDQLPFLPNPNWSGTDTRLGTVDAALRPFVDLTLDEDHFASRASGAQFLGASPTRGYFRGREEELEVLSAWLDGPLSGLWVVTGKPGVGKSALLGVLVCAAHKQLRQRYADLWRYLPAKPARNDRLAAVHARQLSTTQVADALARQMGASDGARPTGGWSPQQLLDLATLESHDGPFTFVIDALDEAQSPTELVKTLLLPLLSADEGYIGQWPLRLLVGTRRDERFMPLFDRARGVAGNLVDLDEIDPQQLRKALSAYIESLLIEDEWFEPAQRRPMVRAFAEAAAARLTDQPLEWGEFLSAGLLTRYQLDARVDDVADARTQGEQAPRDLGHLLTLDLSRTGQPDHLGPVLTAVAFAHGAGMPERIIARVAAAFCPGLDEPLAIEQVRAGLDAGRFYLRRDVARDGSTLYRLFHESLAESLRSKPLGPGGIALRPALASAPSQEPFLSPRAAVYRAVLRTVPSPVGKRIWRAADPYVLEYLSRHAADAGTLDELVQDAEFLVYGSPESLSQDLPSARSQYARRVTDVYWTSFPVHQQLLPAGRRGSLALAALRLGEVELSGQLQPTAPLRPRWAVSRQIELSHTMTGHHGAVVAVDVAMLGGRPHAITASDDRTARVWDLTAGTCQRTLKGHAEAVVAVAAAVVNGRAHAVTASDDHTARVWDLTTGACRYTLTGHSQSVNAVATAVVDGRAYAVTSSGDRTARVWDLTTGECRHTLTGFTDPITAVAVAILGGSAYLLGSSASHTVHVWDLVSGQLRHSLAEPTGRVDAVAVTLLDLRLHALTFGWHGIEAWDLTTGIYRRAPAGNQVGSETTAIALTREAQVTVLDGQAAVSELNGSPHLLTPSVEGVSAWNMSSGERRRYNTGHAGHVNAVASATLEGRPHAVTASGDRTARVWALQPTGHAVPIHSAPIVAAAFTTLDGQALTVTGSADHSARVWELATGRCLRVLRGHNGPVTAVATTMLEDRPHAVTASGDGLAIWDLATWRSRGRNFANLAGPVNGVTIATLDGRPHALATTSYHTVNVWDLVTGSRRHVLPGDIDRVIAVAIAELDARPHAVIASFGGAVRVWDLTSGVRCRTIRSAGPLKAMKIAMIGDRAHAVAASLNGRVQVWDLATGICQHTLTGHNHAVNAVAVTSVDGRPHLVTSSEDRTVRVWDLTTGGCRHILTGHSGPVDQAAIVTLDSRAYALTTSRRDDTLRVWDVLAGLERAQILLPGKVSTLAVEESTSTVVLGLGESMLIMEPNPNAAVGT